MPSPYINCLICDSSRHATTRCRSNKSTKFHSHLQALLKLEHPDFNSYTLTFLKVIAFFVTYEDNLTLYKIRNNSIHRAFTYNPIPITLSKNRLIAALTERWCKLNIVIKRYAHKPVADNDCPICYENICDYKWSFPLSKWKCILSRKTVVTTCKHTFCEQCWNRCPSMSRYMPEEKDPLGDYVLGRSCPLCRGSVSNKKIITYNTLEEHPNRPFISFFVGPRVPAPPHLLSHISNIPHF